MLQALSTFRRVFTGKSRALIKKGEKLIDRLHDLRLVEVIVAVVHHVDGLFARDTAAVCHGTALLVTRGGARGIANRRHRQRFRLHQCVGVRFRFLKLGNFLVGEAFTSHQIKQRHLFVVGTRDTVGGGDEIPVNPLVALRTWLVPITNRQDVEVVLFVTPIASENKGSRQSRQVIRRLAKLVGKQIRAVTRLFSPAYVLIR
ncbi:MAG: hypothetical protein CAPSK01_000542 [Candidatus Accumulibacter vicinus]|uniref:Uncharacterized protein n=1 Tax=Candidatus Accumulibacter vicinus TaxID=2954382 RepID=A0A084Y535_9PROT|nr:MAG: hypothetical protein CAPSK01_000542 [Candidatus Accumulibacter vicinus]